jgi:hypothetical protein
MSDEPESRTDAGTARRDLKGEWMPKLQLTPDLLVKLFLALVSALLGTNLYTGLASNKELTKAQATWDSEIAEMILRKLDRIENRLP